MSRRRPAAPGPDLQAMAADYQTRNIIPHCRACRRPCCRLTDVVLEFHWREFARIYDIQSSQRDFDRSLADGSGPAYVRKMDGIYYTHGQPCPAYEAATGACALYHSPLKPQNCSDFPLYRDGNSLVADSRCEAVDVTALLRQLRQDHPALEFTPASRAEYGVLHRIKVRRRARPPLR